LIRDWDYASFDWDEGNARKNDLKHGIGRELIEVFLSSAPEFFTDPRHSRHEERYIAVGQVPGGRWIFVSFTVRWDLDRLLLRPISARYMHAKEVRRYADPKSAKKG
jgi:uncharacterized DUF497 family protein